MFLLDISIIGSYSSPTNLIIIKTKVGFPQTGDHSRFDYLVYALWFSYF